MRERKRKHDDAHRPLRGKGKRATRPLIVCGVADRWCPGCGVVPIWQPHVCDGSLKCAADLSAAEKE